MTFITNTKKMNKPELAIIIIIVLFMVVFTRLMLSTQMQWPTGPDS